MNREVLDNFFERGILVLILAILIFAPLAFGAVDAWAFLVVQALTLGMLLVWGFAALDQSETATALATAVLGRAGIHPLCRRALFHGGH